MSKMVQVKVSELTGPALDWAVAIILGWKLIPVPSDVNGLNSGHVLVPPDFPDNWVFPPKGKVSQFGMLFGWSKEWFHCGPLLRFIQRLERLGDGWECEYAPDQPGRYGVYSVTGPTAMIAICRAVVASKLGEAVEVPAELVEVV